MLMSSWKLLRHLIFFWTSIENPVFLRETNRPPVWHSIYQRLTQATGLALTLGGLACYLATLLVFFLNNLLILLVPVLGFWMLLTGLTLAPIIVGERENRTWETLRTTPMNTEAILLGKAGGALWWQRDMIRVMIGLLLLFAVGIGLISLLLVPTADEPTGNVPSYLLCSAAVILPILIAVLFVIDRAQQFVLTTVSILAASAATKSSRLAMSASTVMAFVLWLLDIGVAGTLLALQPDRVTLTTQTDWLALATLGPVVGYLSELTPGKMVVYVGGTLLVRELLVRWLWRFTVVRAEQF
jgi:hypothetical protein